jgi:hypothetical protein
MNRLLGAVAMLSLAALCVAPRADAQSTTYKGIITDEKLNCEQTPMKTAEGIKDHTACVLYWQHSASPNEKLVLYDAATKTTYMLDDQTAVQPYVAEKVIVTGTLNGKEIKVSKIAVDEAAYKTAAATTK